MDTEKLIAKVAFESFVYVLDEFGEVHIAATNVLDPLSVPRSRWKPPRLQVSITCSCVCLTFADEK